MELSPEELMDLIIKAYERGQRTAISRLASELHDFKHDFYEFSDEEKWRYQRILTELERLKSVVEAISNLLKQEFSTISAPHEAPKESTEEGSPSDDGLLTDRDLRDIIIERIFRPEGGRYPFKAAQILLYLYMRGGSAPVRDVYRRFDTAAYAFLRSKALAGKVWIEGQGDDKIIRLSDDLKRELDQILASYRRE